MEAIGDGTLKDLASDEQVYVAVKIHDESVGLGLSARNGADLESFFSVDDAKKIIQWLQEAVQRAEGSSKLNN